MHKNIEETLSSNREFQFRVLKLLSWLFAENPAFSIVITIRSDGRVIEPRGFAWISGIRRETQTDDSEFRPVTKLR